MVGEKGKDRNALAVGGQSLISGERETRERERRRGREEKSSRTKGEKKKKEDSW